MPSCGARMCLPLRLNGLGAIFLRGLRSRLLTVPSRLRQIVPHLTTSDVTVIDRELRDALQELGAGGKANADA